MSELEEEFLSFFALYQRLNKEKLPYPVREHRFLPPRKWRFDFAWPELQVAVEIEGGLWTGGRHSRGAGMQADMTKYNEAARHGWRVLRLGERHLRREPDATYELIRDTLSWKD